MISDFVYPNYGGVETHILNISKELKKLNHEVIIITHEYKNYLGEISFEGIKIYYIKTRFLFRNTTLFNLLMNGKIFKDLFIKYNINLVHGHQSSSPLALEGIFHAQCLNIKTVFTEHSLFPIYPPLNILINNLISPIIRNVDLKIAVSKACQINLSKRLNITKDKILVIRNSVDFELFNPFYRNIEKENYNLINLIVITRLEERKGVCILIKLIDLIFYKKNNFKLKIIGSGSLETYLGNYVKFNKMENKIQLIGELKHKQIPFELNSSDIFINTSLTEAFCISILEAAACGLSIVSTNVGGVKEVLPKNMIYLTKVNEKSIYKYINIAAKNLNNKNIYKNYNKIKKYNWEYITNILNIYYNSKRNYIKIETISDWIYNFIKFINILYLSLI